MQWDHKSVNNNRQVNGQFRVNGFPSMMEWTNHKLGFKRLFLIADETSKSDGRSNIGTIAEWGVKVKMGQQFNRDEKI